MRVGVYVDGFNVYYGGRNLCGRGTPGWRWLDLRPLATDLVGRRASWQDAPGWSASCTGPPVPSAGTAAPR